MCAITFAFILSSIISFVEFLHLGKIVVVFHFHFASKLVDFTR